MNHQVRIIRRAYDRTVDDFRRGISDEDRLPAAFKRSQRYKRFRKTTRTAACGSDAPAIRAYLRPRKGMKFLDIGSCVNLMGKKLYRWPSLYYGIDISPKLIKATRHFVRQKNITVGGLFVTEMTSLPFPAAYFDICALVGVLEYYDIHYIKKALKEAHRVLKPGGRMYVDMPNFRHPDCRAMIEFESYLGRTRKNVPANKAFEKELAKLFVVDKTDGTRIMTGYFAKPRK